MSSKPNLRGLHHASMIRSLAGMTFSVAAVGYCFYQSFNKPRKARVAEFYMNYDADEAAERMRQAGLFHSVVADGVCECDPAYKKP